MGKGGSNKSANGKPSVYFSALNEYEILTDLIRRHQAKIQKVLTWLGTTDALPADILERHLRDYLPGSCDWFPQHEATQLWMGDTAKNPLLWLCGKPGAGMIMYRRG
jgi:hypothetical protein